MTTQMMLLAGLLLTIAVFVASVIIWHAANRRDEQRIQQNRLLIFEQNRIDIEQATREACSKILDELHRAHLPPDEDWLRWQQTRPDEEADDNLFMPDIPDFDSEDDMDCMNDDLSIPGDDLWGDQL